MFTKFRKLVTLALLIWAGTACANSVLWKIDEKGRKVFYNDPPKIKSNLSQAGEVLLGYSSKFEEYQELIRTISQRHGVDPELVKAVIQVESNYNDRAVSHKGACGLMQLMPATAARYGVQSIFEPAQNIDGGVRYLRDLLQLFNSDVRLSVAAYNAGENRVQRINDIPDFLETQNYVRKVMALYRGEKTYTPYGGGSARIKNVTYYKFVDSKGVTHYSASPVAYPNSTKVSFSYSW
jgi:soluble lytic murein transglycosylase-like protein